MTIDTLTKPGPAAPDPDATAALIATAFSHIAQGDTEYKSGGLRDFFLYRDLGIAEATRGQVIAQLVKANLPPDPAADAVETASETCKLSRFWATFLTSSRRGASSTPAARSPARGGLFRGRWQPEFSDRSAIRA